MKAAEFKARCLELMDEVAESGHTIIITKRGKAVAALGPAPDRRGSVVGFLKGNFNDVADVIAPVEVDWGPADPEIRRPGRRSGR